MKERLLIILIAAVLIEALVFQYKAIPAIEAGMKWSYFYAEMAAEEFIKNYDETLPVKAKKEAILDYRSRYASPIKAVEVLGKGTFFYRKYVIEGFSDFLWMSETAADDHPKQEVVEREYRQLKRFCEKLVKMDDWVRGA